MKTGACLVSLLLVVAAGAATCGQTGDEPAEKRFRSEYLAACAAWENRCSNAVGSIKIATDDNERKNAPHRDAIFSFKCKLPAMASLEITSAGGGRSSHSVEVMNAKYWFTATKTREDQPFVVGSLKKAADAKPAPAGGLQRTPMRSLSQLLAAPYATTIPNQAMMSHPRFEVRSMLQLVKNGKNLLRVEFDRPNTEGREVPKFARDFGGFEGFFVVCPDEKWVLYEFECREKKGPGQSAFTGTVEYAGTREGHPIPKRAIWQTLRLPERDVIKTTFIEFVDLRFADVPDQDFTLSAFGIAEDTAKRP